jgi:hypothetical protein
MLVNAMLPTIFCGLFLMFGGAALRSWSLHKMKRAAMPTIIAKTAASRIVSEYKSKYPDSSLLSTLQFANWSCGIGAVLAFGTWMIGLVLYRNIS